MKYPAGSSVVIWEGDNLANATEYDGARCIVLGEVKRGAYAGQIVVWGVTLSGEVFLGSFYPCKVIYTHNKKVMARLEQYFRDCADEEAYRGVD